MLKSPHKAINSQDQLQADNREISKKMKKSFKDITDDKVAESSHSTCSREEKLLELHN